MLNAQWLETFIVLAETEHFTKTAEICGMTQPGVSQHLRKLEIQVGYPLISREGKTFSLTPAGDAVLALATARRVQERKLFETISHDDPHTGRVSIGSSGGLATLLYPNFFKIMQQSPNLQIRLEATPQDSVLTGVTEGRFDLGIADHEPTAPRLNAEYLGREELCLMLPKDVSKSTVNFQSLERMGLIAHPDVYQYADELFSKNFKKSFKGSEHLRVRTYVNQLSQILAPVECGFGYTLLTQSGISAYRNLENVQIMRLPKRHYHNLWLVFRRGRVLPACVRRVSDQIRETASTLEVL